MTYQQRCQWWVRDLHILLAHLRCKEEQVILASWKEDWQNPWTDDPNPDSRIWTSRLIANQPTDWNNSWDKQTMQQIVASRKNLHHLDDVGGGTCIPWTQRQECWPNAYPWLKRHDYSRCPSCCLWWWWQVSRETCTIHGHLLVTVPVFYYSNSVVSLDTDKTI